MGIPKIQAYGLINYEGPAAGRYASDIISKCDKNGYSLKWAGYSYVKKERTVPVLTKSHNMYYDYRVYAKLCELMDIKEDGNFKMIFVREHEGSNVFLCSCKMKDRLIMRLAERADDIVRKSKDCDQPDTDAMWESLNDLEGSFFEIDRETLSQLI